MSKETPNDRVFDAGRGEDRREAFDRMPAAVDGETGVCRSWRKTYPMQEATKAAIEAAGGIVLVVWDETSLELAMKIRWLPANRMTWDCTRRPISLGRES